MVTFSFLQGADEEQKWTDLLTSSVRPTTPIPKEVQEILNDLTVESNQINLREFEEADINDLNREIPVDYVICHLRANTRNS